MRYRKNIIWFGLVDETIAVMCTSSYQNAETDSIKEQWHSVDILVSSNIIGRDLKRETFTYCT